MSIFRAYDIRGVYGQDLTEKTARNIGKAFASFISRKYAIAHPKIVIGRDNRTHGESLQEALMKGIRDYGAEVFVLPDCTSPMLYFAVETGGFDGGINVTASHNPKEYNGFKLIGRNAHSICGDEIQEISRMMNEKDFGKRNKGRAQAYEIFPQYLDFFKTQINLRRPFKIVIDAGNSICGKYLPEIFQGIGCSVVPLFCEPDGNFPNHEPDPIVEGNTKMLQKKVAETGADLGIAFDGDGDRFTIVDELGQFHDANETFALLIKDLLSRHPGARIAYTVSCSLIIPEIIQQYHGVGVMTAVGHSFVEKAMRTEKALLGGEQSGHYFMKENFFGYDDAAFAAAKLLEYFSRSRDPVSAHYEKLPKTFRIPELRIPCDDDKKFALVADITDEFSGMYTCLKHDGVRIDFGKNGFLGIRASNTSPCISVIMEAKTKKLLREIQHIAKRVMKKRGLPLSL